MIRHGVTGGNERGIYTGAMDIPLAPAGWAALRQSRTLYPRAGVFFTSGMLRARQTLCALYGDVQAAHIPDLGEYRFGAFEGRSHAQLYAQEPLYRAWLAEDGDGIICPGGESRQMFAARVGRGWQALASAPWDGLAVLVAHGGVLSVLLARLLPEEAPFDPPGNGCGWRLTLDGAGGARTQTPFAAGGDSGDPCVPDGWSSRAKT